MGEQTNSDFSSKPLLRLNTEGHFGPIRRIDMDAKGRWLVSGADDKTVKVWHLADGTLERTLRLPQGGGNLGRVFAVAITPDGTQVAAGGWTGPNQAGPFAIYVFDRTTGALKHRITGLPIMICHLAYAPKGKRLVVTLGQNKGMRLYRTTDYLEIARDEDYGNASWWSDFSSDGNLVISSFDGIIRLYGPGGTLKKAAKAPGGMHPYGVAFSPNAKRIAVGYHDTPLVDVLDSRTLKPRFAVYNTGDAYNGNLMTVAWTANGHTLLAGGLYGYRKWFPIRRWPDGGRGSFEELLVATNTVMSLRPLRDGHLAVGAQNGIALLDATGNVLWEQPNAVADFRGQRSEKGIRLSTAGELVAFGFERWGKHSARFSLQDLTLTLDPKDKDLAGLTLPDEGPHDGLEVTDWVDTNQPKLNGHPLALEPMDFSRSLAIAPDGRRFVLGTEWTLLAFNRAGILLWRQTTFSTVWAANITGDGRYVVAGHGDGTLRWHRLDDGKEVLAFYPHPDCKHWVLWTPQGYYHASAGGEDLIGWHVNHRAPDQAPDFFPASRFRAHFYRPDVIARVLETGDPAEALRLADRDRGKQVRHQNLTELLPPTITILSPEPGTIQDSQRLVLLYLARSRDYPITNVDARRDGRPAEVLEQLQPSVSDDGLEIVGQITLVIPPRECVVELIAYNVHGAGESANFVVNWGGAEDFYKPSLYVLAMGVSAYPSDKLKLRFSARDAEAFAKVLAVQEGGLYKAVQARLLVDECVTREAILQDLEWLRHEVSEKDVAVVFLSGHGINEDGSYYYLCADADPLNPILKALRDIDMQDFLKKIAGKTVLLIDTCYSGSLSPGKGVPDSLPVIDKFVNELTDAESGVVVYSSSTGREQSLEDERWGHGAFTYALLEAVRDGKADFTDNGHVTIDELGLYLDNCVKDLTNGRRHPTMTKPQAVRNYPIFRVRQSN